MKERGRPPIYSGSAKVYITTTGKSRLQPSSDRRAIINKLVDGGGCMTLDQIDSAFGFTIREKVVALQRAGWVRIEEQP